MPISAPHPCNAPGCPTLTHARFCGEHLRLRDEQHDRRRGGSAARGYDSRWQKLRAMVLCREPLCRVCQKAATDVDHIVPKRRGGADSFGNLQPLCHECHSRKTNEDMRR